MIGVAPDQHEEIRVSRCVPEIALLKGLEVLERDPEIPRDAAQVLLAPCQPRLPQQPPDLTRLLLGILGAGRVLGLGASVHHEPPSSGGRRVSIGLGSVGSSPAPYLPRFWAANGSR
jgi:hypothetical protein